MHVLCVVPARLGCTRLHHKPLRLLAGQPLIKRVVERVRAFGLDGPLVVATDDRRVVETVSGTGAHAVLTDPGHRSGTERVAEVARRAEFARFDIILNVQGDEPFVPAAAVTGALERVAGGDDIGTAAAPLAPGHAADPSKVKVTVDAGGHAVSFSRSFAPASLHHIGVYAYRRNALLDWVAAMPTAAETGERLEQLRPLALGMTIGVARIGHEVLPGIDTEDDLALAEHSFGAGWGEA